MDIVYLYNRVKFGCESLFVSHTAILDQFLFFCVELLKKDVDVFSVACHSG